MTLSLRLMLAAALLAISPGAAMAQAFASSLSVTFGPGGGASVGSGGGVTMSEVSSLSLGSAQGSYAAAGSIAGGGSTAAVAGAAMDGGLTPVVRVRPAAGSALNLYETEVFFGDIRSISGYEQNLGGSAN